MTWANVCYYPKPNAEELRFAFIHRADEVAAKIDGDKNDLSRKLRRMISQSVSSCSFNYKTWPNLPGTLELKGTTVGKKGKTPYFLLNVLGTSTLDSYVRKTGNQVNQTKIDLSSNICVNVIELRSYSFRDHVGSKLMAALAKQYDAKIMK